MPVLTAFENVELPLMLTHLSRRERERRLVLDMVNLGDRTSHYPSELSGGQQQRVAIARALITDPVLIVADEPTGDLDRTSATDVLAMLQRMNAAGKTIIMVTRRACGRRRALARASGKGADRWARRLTGCGSARNVRAEADRAQCDAAPAAHAADRARLTIAVLAFGLLHTVVDAWYAGAAAASSGRLVTRNAISLVFPLPVSYENRIRGVEGVTAVVRSNWFGGIYRDPKNFFASFAVSDNYLDLYPEFIIPAQQRRLRSRPPRLPRRSPARDAVRLQDRRRDPAEGHDLPGHVGFRRARHPGRP